MKIGVLLVWSFGVYLGMLPLTGGCQQEETNASPGTARPVLSVATNPAPPLAEAAAPAVSEPPEAAVTDAAVSIVSTAKPLPPNIRPNGPVSEVIKLADSGLEEKVIMACVTNSTSVFALSADEIIYLNDIGVPAPVVTAMIQRDQELRGAPASVAAAAPPVYAAPTNMVPAAPAPGEVAPQPDYTGGGYPTDQLPVEATDAGFYDSLAPYGTWVDVAGYGRCWQPTVVVVSAGWQPYYNCGRWLYSDCGWYWHSDYSWGWAPFHYGRWFQHSRLGWCWRPDAVWGPAWVSWRHTDNYCGWAPLPPAALYRPGFGLTWHGQSANASFGFGLGAGSYAFVSWSHFQDHHLTQHGLSPHQINEVYPSSIVVNRISGARNLVVNQGVSPARISAATHQEVRRVSLRDLGGTRPANDHVERLDAGSKTLTVYRPSLSALPRPSVTAAEPGQPGMRYGSGARTTANSPASPISTQPATPAQNVGVPRTWAPADSAAARPPSAQPHPDKPATVTTRGQDHLTPSDAAGARTRTTPPGSLSVTGRQADQRVQPSVPPAVGQPSTVRATAPTPAPAPSPWLASHPASPQVRPDSPQRVNRLETPTATPWLQTQSTPPGSLSAFSARVPQQAAPAYRPSVQPAPVEVPRYNSASVSASQRSYSAPAMSAPAAPSGTQWHSAPSAPSASASRGGSSDKAGR